MCLFLVAIKFLHKEMPELVTRHSKFRFALVYYEADVSKNLQKSSLPRAAVSLTVLCNMLQFEDKHHSGLLKMIADQLQCSPADIVDFELNVCDTQDGVIGGMAFIITIIIIIIKINSNDNDDNDNDNNNKNNKNNNIKNKNKNNNNTNNNNNNNNNIAFQLMMS